jgi:hypothetical protein
MRKAQQTAAFLAPGIDTFCVTTLRVFIVCCKIFDVNSIFLAEVVMALPLTLDANDRLNGGGAAAARCRSKL